MKKKIKLRDMTKEQYQSWVGSNCRHLCSECIFRFTACDFSNCWVDNKGAYSDKFLDQEIEIETDILTEDEKKALRLMMGVCGLDKPDYVTKAEQVKGYFSLALSFGCRNANIPLSEDSFKGMDANRPYRPEDLGL